MKVYTKILLTTLLLVLPTMLVGVGVTYALSRNALTRLAESWLETRLSEAMRAAAEHEELLRRYGLDQVAASVKQAQADAGTAMLSIKIGEQGYIYAVNSQGLVAVHPDRQWVGRDLSAERWFQEMSRQRGGRLAYTWQGTGHLAMYEYFPAWDWYVVATDPQSEVYGAVNQLRTYVLVLGLSISAVTALVLMFVTRQLTTPLRLLEAGAQQVGQGRLDVYIPVRASDEIGALADAFNSMTDRLRSLVSSLEQRVAERKEAEEALRREHDLVTRIMETSPAGITLVNRMGQIVFANGRAEQVLGLTRDEITWRTYNAPAWRITDYAGQPFPDEDLPFRRVMATGQPVYDVRHAIEWPDGRRVLLSINATPLFDEVGQVDGMVATVEDVTERVRAEEARRESEARYRGLFEDSPVSLWEEDFAAVKQRIEALRRQGVADFDSFFESHPEIVAECVSLARVIAVNKATLKLYGVSSAAELLAGLDRVIPPEAYSVFKQELVWIAQGLTEFEWEGVNCKLTGERMDIRLYWSAAPGCEDSLARVLVSIEDITEHKRAERERQWLYQEMRRRAGELTALIEIDRDISASLDLTTVLARIAMHARDLLEADDSEVYLLEPDGQTLRAIIAIGPSADRIKTALLHLGEGIVGCVGQSGVAEIVANVERDPRTLYLAGSPRQAQTLVCAPLVSKGQVIGVMALARPVERGPFEPADLNFLLGLSGQAAIAIENARLYEAQRRQAQDLAAINAVIRALGSSLETDILLQVVVRELGRLLAFDRASLALVNPDQRTFTMIALEDSGLPFLAQGMMLRVEDSAATDDVMAGRTHVTDDLSTESAWLGERLLYQAGLRSRVNIPLIHGGRVIGSLNVASLQPAAFGQREVALLEQISGPLAIAIENARLYAEAQERATELSAALARQAELDRLKSEFVQNVSHELRTPLAIIMGYAEMLDAGELGALLPEQQAPLSVVARRTRMLKKLVDDLTAILEMETQEVSREPVDLVELVRSVLPDFQVAADKAELTVTAEIEPGLPFVLGDPTRLRQVLDNLLNNALKFTPPGGSVTVRLRHGRPGVVLQVADTGIGIPADKLGRIFERFYQVDGSARRRYGGVGLGLALVKEITEAHGGRVTVESQVGQGTTFTVSLPGSDKL